MLVVAHIFLRNLLRLDQPLLVHPESPSNAFHRRKLRFTETRVSVTTVMISGRWVTIASLTFNYLLIMMTVTILIRHLILNHQMCYLLQHHFPETLLI